MVYVGRDMTTSHKGMQISTGDWTAFMGHLDATLRAFEVPQQERDDVTAFIESTQGEIVEC